MSARRLCVIAAALALAAGCGGSAPTSPTTTFSVAGTWTGTLQYVTAGVTVTEDATLALTQPSTNASGSWSASSASTGTIGFAVASTVTGTFTINQPNVGSAACAASSTISGTASATDLVLNVANLAQTAACPWATSMKFTLRK